MKRLRLLADDLTGALDTTAELTPLTGPVPVFWPRVMPDVLKGPAALDSGTREWASDVAAAEVERLCRHLRGASIAFKKIDSLMRGPTLREVAACMKSRAWKYAVLAPAFPFQQRVTRDGRQLARVDESWLPAGPDLVAELAALGVPARLADGELRPGINVFDAENDSALRAIAEVGRRCAESVLWIGTGGLAQALAANQPSLPTHILPRPLLGLFGSDHQATANQLAACHEHWLEIAAEAFDPVIARMEAAGLALVSFRLSNGLSRDAAARDIAGRMARLVECINPPGTIAVAGGETLRSLCDAVDAESLLVTGRMMPGVACSVIQGGQWNGVTVVSKSGAFGPPALLRRLLLEERTAP